MNPLRGERMIHVRREFGSKGERTDRTEWLEDLRKANPALTYNKVRGLEEGRTPKNSIDEIAKGLAGCHSLLASGYTPMQVMGWVLSGEGEKPVRKAPSDPLPDGGPPGGSRGALRLLEESGEGDVVVLEPDGVARVSARSRINFPAMPIDLVAKVARLVRIVEGEAMNGEARREFDAFELGADFKRWLSKLSPEEKAQLRGDESFSYLLEARLRRHIVSLRSCQTSASAA